MIVTTEAIVLKIHPWSQTSHMVTWLSAQHGKITTSVKGACRPKSAFLGQYDLFYTCELLFYRREHNGAHAIRECQPRVLREGLRPHWRKASLANYMTDLIAHVSLPQQEQAQLFSLLSHYLDRLAASSTPPLATLMLQFEIQLLHLLGLQPDLTTCPHCHSSERLWIQFSLASGRCVCSHLGQLAPREVPLTLHQGILRLFHRINVQSAPNGTFNGDFRGTNSLPSNLLLGLSRFLGMFIGFHLEVSAEVRRLTWEMVVTELTQKTV